MVSFDVLKREDDRTSEAVCQFLKDDALFKQLSKVEGDDIVARDADDEKKLEVGIKIGVERGVLSATPDVGTVQKIDVVGKTADQVADIILNALKVEEGKGHILVLQGLSGTGKGTTVGKLRERLPKTVCWSNGNLFRSLTLMALQKRAAEKPDAPLSEFLKAEDVKAYMDRVQFLEFDGEYDVVLDGKTRVSTICNTELKTRDISANVPTIAEQTQGEVVTFAAGAVAKLGAAGFNVILEGRAQTLNHIPTPYRFELTIPDTSLLGMRRAAQRVVAAALNALKDNAAPSDEDVAAALKQACVNLTKD